MDRRPFLAVVVAILVTLVVITVISTNAAKTDTSNPADWKPILVGATGQLQIREHSGNPATYSVAPRIGGLELELGCIDDDTLLTKFGLNMVDIITLATFRSYADHGDVTVMATIMVATDGQTTYPKRVTRLMILVP